MVNTEIVSCMTSLEEIMKAVGTAGVDMKSTAKGTNLGKLKVHSCNSETIPSFTDYLKDGWEIALIGAIDFTYSNGNPSNPTSLHHLSDSLNHYEQAIQAVGRILNDYDSDHQYPFYGFGGAPHFMGSGHTEVSHCFALNGN